MARILILHSNNKVEKLLLNWLKKTSKYQQWGNLFFFSYQMNSFIFWNVIFSFEIS